MTRTSLFKAAVAVTAISFAPAIAQAQTVFNFIGSARVSDPNTAVGDSDNRLFIDFLTNGSVQNFNTAVLNGTITAVEDTDLIGVATGTGATMGSIRDLEANATGFSGTPVSPFITIGGYSFTLSSSTTGNTFGPISLFGDAGGTTAVFSIAGTVTGPGLNPGSTFTGRFSSSFDNITPAALIAQIDNGTITPANFGARFTIQNAAVIPEPSTYALLGSGVAMLGFYARRRRQA